MVLLAFATAAMTWCVFGHRAISWRKTSPTRDLRIGALPTLLYVGSDVPYSDPFNFPSSWRITTFPRWEWERVFVAPSYFWKNKAGTAPGGAPQAISSEVRVPVWMVAGALAGIGVWLYVSDRRRARGLCRKCGYDLSGLRGKPCPECGTAPAARS